MAFVVNLIKPINLVNLIKPKMSNGRSVYDVWKMRNTDMEEMKKLEFKKSQDINIKRLQDCIGEYLSNTNKSVIDCNTDYYTFDNDKYRQAIQEEMDSLGGDIKIKNCIISNPEKSLSNEINISIDLKTGNCTCFKRDPLSYHGGGMSVD